MAMVWPLWMKMHCFHCMVNCLTLVLCTPPCKNLSRTKFEPGRNARTTGKHPAVLLGHWPTAPIQLYAPVQQQSSSTGCHNQRNGGDHFSGGNGGGVFPQQPSIFGGNGIWTQPSTCPPTPYKHMRIGTTATPPAAILTMPTPVQRVRT
jgi:hypothetical protein